MNTPRLPNIHPGEILQLDFLEPTAITAYRLSTDIEVSQTRISEILNGKRAITADTAHRLSRYSVFFFSLSKIIARLQV